MGLNKAVASTQIKRSQLQDVNFEPQPYKKKPGKRGRPARVIQTNILNAAGHATTIVIPGTTQVYRDYQGDEYPLRIALGKVGQLKDDTDLLINQIRTISNWRSIRDKPLSRAWPGTHEACGGSIAGFGGGVVGSYFRGGV